MGAKNLLLNKAIEANLSKNIKNMEQIFSNDDTLRKRTFYNKINENIKFCIFFIDGMVNTEIINENILRPIMESTMLCNPQNMLDCIQNQVLITNEVNAVNSYENIVSAILYGDTVLFVDGSNLALVINSKGWQSRSISEPNTERVLRGSRESFTESLMTNLSMIRRRLLSSDLKFEFQTVGRRTNTKVCICYVDGIVKPEVLKELKERLKKIDIDGVIDTNYIAELIRNSKFSLFKTTGVTERPDTVVAKMLEGRITLILDGCPEALTVPYLFIENFQAADDYYLNFYFSSVGRMLRLSGFFLTTSIPAIYVAITTFHFEIIPLQLAISIAKSREGVPFPTIVECLMMLFIFEMIRETGIRMPSLIGQSLSIVGALVIGQAAVEAKFVSAPIVIVVAITAITGLVNTTIKGATIYLRVIFLLFASVLGFYGYLLGVIGFLVHLLSLQSFGQQYLSDVFAPNFQKNKDLAFRAPWWKMLTRPEELSHNRIRETCENEQNNS